ncbi:MAG TPA: hypothetical protein VFK48_11040 [Usitatibacter sp.]|nr:hypothetical protein [Usitatibacter sp.]
MGTEAGALDGELGAALRIAAERKAQAAAGFASGHAIDGEHPWLGLDSFTEETRAFFFGREQEVAELGRRVQRKLLTILFGQSGLGKTSILRAGLVPKLRPNGFCPVYVRIDYAADSPPPAEQIKAAIFRATREQGQWTQSGAAVEGESLWEFLHHRDDFLRDAEGRTVVPLLIFDQFEEIFTLAQADDAGRRRAAQFIEDLADLVENRPPKALEARIEGDESISEGFDFARADYRILIALREDYLAHLEGVKSVMPSITQNRMRLARMNGQQALAAVLKPGGRLVSEEVAESIVRFVAGGSELPNAEVEPSLLSLICRELNNARIAQGRSEISVDLLAGNKETILAEFYERALADQPEAVRRFIEDEMLTESGFRESLAEERVRKAFNAAGASPDALAKLVDRRLLRVEERLDLRRVELTHDVLCSVVADSRDLRHEREAKELAERELAAQKAREAAARRSLVRARQVAAFCAVLAIAAIAGAVFGYQNMKRAQQAEALSEKTRLMAEAARGEAEKLIVYLLDDFHDELIPIGGLKIVEDLAGRALLYYRDLPPELRTADTERNRALALIRYASVLRVQERAEEAGKAVDESFAVLSGMHGRGDSSEATLLGLALARQVQSSLSTVSRLDAAQGAAFSEEGLAFLAKLPASSLASRKLEASLKVQLGFTRMRGGRSDAIAPLREAFESYRQLGALQLQDLSVSTGFTEAGMWLSEALFVAGRNDEGKAVVREALQTAEGVLERRPAHMLAMRNRAIALGRLGAIEVAELRMGSGLRQQENSVRAWEALVARDPANTLSRNNLEVQRSESANTLGRLGRVSEGIRARQAVVALETKVPMSPFLARNLATWNAWLAESLAEAGEPEKAAAAMAACRRLAGVAAREGRQANATSIDAGYYGHVGANVALAAGRIGEARKLFLEGFDALRGAAPAKGSVQAFRKWRVQGMLHRNGAIASYREQDFAAAEAAAAKSAEVWRMAPARDSSEELFRLNTELLRAKALARLGRHREAEALLRPILAFHADARVQSSDDIGVQVQRAEAALATALIDGAQRVAKLAEALAIIERLPAEARRTRSVALVREEIVRERAKSA